MVHFGQPTLVYWPGCFGAIAAIMKKVATIFAALAVLLIPAIVFAKPPPPTSGGAPEPVSMLLMAAGAAPAYLTYKWVKLRNR